VSLERGSLSLMSISEELLEWKSSGSGSRKSRLIAVGICCTLYPQKLVLTSPTCCGRSVDIVCLLAKATGFSFLVSPSQQMPGYVLCTSCDCPPHDQNVVWCWNVSSAVGEWQFVLCPLLIDRLCSVGLLMNMMQMVE
jgi:hypothetical protein